MDIEQVIIQAIEAFKSGREDEAHKMMVQALRENPNHEQAWMVMARMQDDPERKKQCLERVISINPDNAKARRVLDQLTKPADDEAWRQPQPEAIPASDLTERLRIPKSEGRDNRGSRMWLMIGGGVVLLLCVVCVIIFGVGRWSLDLVEQQAAAFDEQVAGDSLANVRGQAAMGTLNTNINSLNNRDLSTYMLTIHPDAPVWEETEEALALLDEVETWATLERAVVVSAEPDEVQIEFTLLTEATSGGDFRDNRVTGLMILRLDGQQWKIYDQDVYDVDYLN